MRNLMEYDETIEGIENEAPVVLVNNDNLQILLEAKYLTRRENGFLIALASYLQSETNIIYNSENHRIMTVTDIATTLHMSRKTASKHVENLKRKGIIFEGKHTATFGTKPLYLNPELFYFGNTGKVDITLTQLLLGNDVIEQNGIKLQWKVFTWGNKDYGLFCEREFYDVLKKHYTHIS